MFNAEGTKKHVLGDTGNRAVVLTVSLSKSHTS